MARTEHTDVTPGLGVLIAEPAADCHVKVGRFVIGVLGVA